MSPGLLPDSSSRFEEMTRARCRRSTVGVQDSPDDHSDRAVHRSPILQCNLSTATVVADAEVWIAPISSIKSGSLHPNTPVRTQVAVYPRKEDGRLAGESRVA